jgi:hypothetical protein
MRTCRYEIYEPTQAPSTPASTPSRRIPSFAFMAGTSVITNCVYYRWIGVSDGGLQSVQVIVVRDILPPRGEPRDHPETWPPLPCTGHTASSGWHLRRCGRSSRVLMRRIGARKIPLNLWAFQLASVSSVEYRPVAPADECSSAFTFLPCPIKRGTSPPIALIRCSPDAPQPNR